jgi:hypothetical protein
MEVDSIYTSGDHLKGGGLFGGVYTLQETSLTGPISIYKLVPKVQYPSMQELASIRHPLHTISSPTREKDIHRGAIIEGFKYCCLHNFVKLNLNSTFFCTSSCEISHSQTKEIKH